MKKKVLYCLFAFAVAFSFTALVSCGDDDKDDAATEAAGGSGSSDGGQKGGDDGETTDKDPVTVKVNGHDFVDLGLPSGLLWAANNLGATAATEYGSYYAWGETTAKTVYSWENYKWCNGDEDHITKYGTDGKTVLDAADDAATSLWGTPCRIATKEEFKELEDNCTAQFTTYKGVSGCKLKSKTNGNFIFLPAAGMYSDEDLLVKGTRSVYWAATVDSEMPEAAYGTYSTLNIAFASNTYARSVGLPVRPVASVN